MSGVLLEIVKVRGEGSNWAQKATVNGEVRYRGFYYKREAIRNLLEWENIVADFGQGGFMRDFYHNFNTADELGIKEI